MLRTIYRPLNQPVRGNNWTHQQRLMQALFSIGPELQKCPPEVLPAILEFMGPMVLGKAT